MKMGSGLVAAAVLLMVAAQPAFARSRHRAPLDSQQMRITNSPTTEPIVAPPVTVPESSIYDTPRVEKIAAALPPLPVLMTRQVINPITPPVAEAAAPLSVDGAKVDGAFVGPAAPHDGVQTAAIEPPADFVGPPTPRTLRTPGAVLFDQTRDDSALAIRRN